MKGTAMNSKKNSTTRRMYVDLPPAMAAQYDRAMAVYNAAIAAGKTEEEAEQLFHQAMKAS